MVTQLVHFYFPSIKLASQTCHMGPYIVLRKKIETRNDFFFLAMLDYLSGLILFNLEDPGIHVCETKVLTQP